MKNKITFWLSIAAVVISVAAVSFSTLRTTPYEIDFLTLIVGVLTLFVAILAVFLGYNYFMFERKIKELVDNKLGEVKIQIKEDIEKVEKNSIKATNSHMCLTNLRIVYALNEFKNNEYANMIISFLKYTIEDYRESGIDGISKNIINAVERVMESGMAENADEYTLKLFRKELSTLSGKDDRVENILAKIDSFRTVS